MVATYRPVITQNANHLCVPLPANAFGNTRQTKDIAATIRTISKARRKFKTPDTSKSPANARMQQAATLKTEASS